MKRLCSCLSAIHKFSMNKFVIANKAKLTSTDSVYHALKEVSILLLFFAWHSFYNFNIFKNTFIKTHKIYLYDIIFLMLLPSSTLFSNFNYLNFMVTTQILIIILRLKQILLIYLILFKMLNHHKYKLIKLNK